MLTTPAFFMNQNARLAYQLRANNRYIQEVVGHRAAFCNLADERLFLLMG